MGPLSSRIRSPFARHVLIFSGATAFGQVLGILVTPLLTRLYSPENYGAFSLYASIAAILTTAATFRLELAVPIADDEDCPALLRGGLCLLGVAVLFCCFAVSLPQVRDLVPDLPFLGWLLVPAGVLVAGLNNLVASTTLRDHEYGQLARKQIWQTVIRSGSQLSLGFLRFTQSGLVVGHLVGAGAGTLSLALRSATVRRAVTWRSIRLPVRKSLARYRRYATHSMPAAFLNSGAIQLPAVLLASGFGAALVGQFSLAQRVTAAPLGLIATSTARVYRGSLSGMVRSGNRNVLPTYRKVVITLALVGAIPSAVLLIFGPAIFDTVFGTMWRPAGKLVRLLSPMLYSGFVFGPIAESLNALQRQHWQLRWDASRTAAVVACLLVVPIIGGDATQTIAAYSALMTTWYLGHGALTYRALTQHARAGITSE